MSTDRYHPFSMAANSSPATTVTAGSTHAAGTSQGRNSASTSAPAPFTLSSTRGPNTTTSRTMPTPAVLFS